MTDILTREAMAESGLTWQTIEAWASDVKHFPESQTVALAIVALALRARVRELEAFVRDVCAPGCAAGWATFPAVVVPPCGSCLYCRARALLAADAARKEAK